MTNIIKTFSHPQFGETRVFVRDGNPWFVGKDIADTLGYSNPSKTIRDHVEDMDKTTITIRSGGSNYQTQAIIINESGLYSLILSSKLPKAHEFKHWVTGEVLPSIRQHGAYMTPKTLTKMLQEPESIIVLLNQLQTEQAKRIEAEKTIEQKDKILEAQRPKVIFAEAIVSSDGDILIRDLAKLLTQNGIEIGQARLFRWLRDNGYLFKKETRPIQKWVERGLFSTTVSLIETHHGTIESCTTKVTGRGQQYFINGFLNGTFKI